MSEEKFLMTEAGRANLIEECNQLESIEREKAKQRIKHARSFCDFGEDSEYEASLKELARIDRRIAKIKHMVQQAELIKKTRKETVELGSTVTFKEIPNGERETYTIVGIEEADPTEGKISYQSPIAKQLLHAKLNDERIVKTPHRDRKIEIIAIS